MADNNTFNLGSKLVLENGLAMTLANAASDPSSPQEGDLYFNTTSLYPKFYNGSTWQTLGTGTVTAVSVVTANGLAGTSSGGATPALTLSTTITGVLQGNGTAISAATTTGSGSVVLATSPTLVTPALGTPSALVGTNITGTASSLTAGNINATSNSTLTTLSALSLPTSQLSGTISLTTQVSGILPIANGGTNASSAASAFNNLNPMTTTGDTIYEASASTAARLPIGSTGQVLTVAGGLPTWATPTSSSITFTDASTTPIYTVGGSPGNSISITLKTETANTVFAGPTTGSAAQPAFRSLVSADIPDLSGTYELNSNFAVRSYQNSIALAASTSSPTTIASLEFPIATYGSITMDYVMIEDTTGSRRQGTFRYATDGTNTGYSDDYAESAVLGNGIILSATVVSTNVVVQFTGTNTNAVTMRAQISAFAA